MRAYHSLALVVLLLAVASGCNSNPPRVTTRSEMAEDEHRSFLIPTEIADDKLVFVAISGELKGAEPAVGLVQPGSSSNDEWWCILNRPDGTSESLPNGTQLFQSIGGEWRESDADVTLDEIREFLRSKPEEISIDTLLGFVDNFRKKPYE